MRRTSLRTCLALLLLALGVAAPLLADSKPTPQPLKMADILAWKSIRGAAVSNDGQWFAYRLAPAEGDGEVILRQTRGDKEVRFPAGQLKGFGFGDVAFSDDSKWLAFTVHPTAKEAKQQGEKKATGKVALVNVASGEKTEFEKVRRHAFSGEASNWIALHKTPPEAQLSGSEKWSGSDLLLRELATGVELNLGNVSEFAFDKKGQWLALVIDAQGQSGNGVLLRNMATGALLPLDNARAVYKGLTWTEKGDAFAVLRGAEDKAYENKLYSVLGFHDLAEARPHKAVYDPKADKASPAGMTVSPDRNPSWTDDLTGLLFGIQELRKKEDKPATKEDEKKAAEERKPEKEGTPQRKGPPGKAGAESDKPDLVVWHWKDPRLQSMQQKQADMDKSFSYLCLYRPKDKKFIRLADDKLRRVTAAPKQRWAIGLDDTPYELISTLDGKRFQDVYVTDLKTGARRLALKRNRWYFGPSPDGTHFLYYDDGHFYTYELATGQTFNVTRDVPACFVNDEDDHNVAKPPHAPLGWLKGGTGVLLTDGWDVWNVAVHGGQAQPLTNNARAEGVRYRRRINLNPEEKGIDLSVPVYFSVQHEKTKKAGIARLDPGQSTPVRLLWDDADFSTLLKAKQADVYLYTRETYKDYADYHVAGPDLKDGKRLTHANPQQEKYLWSAGTTLVEYTGCKGQKLTATLHLPANHDPGRRYPTVVYIYEKLSWMKNRYNVPTATGFNPSVYTSNGYAVLMPDIVYRINDPGKSAVECVLPALEAAIATGVVDRERVGLHGHSWGGYQTAFLITQTDAFKAAVAGAPLTNLISMYSSIYWNTGSANQPIFESSQGRFTGGYWDNLEAYTRNSPVYYAQNVKTPLLLLHNDKDGAVDWNQGIEYFNTLRRLQKPVVLLQYKGENHGLVKPANQKDYAVRMREFFDHYLRDKPAPGWLKEGVPHLKIEEHLKQRVMEMND
jgi:dienelactone hydrolase